MSETEHDFDPVQELAELRKKQMVEDLTEEERHRLVELADGKESNNDLQPLSVEERDQLSKLRKKQFDLNGNWTKDDQSALLELQKREGSK